VRIDRIWSISAQRTVGHPLDPTIGRVDVVRWSRGQATGQVDPLAIDELDGHVLVVDGVTASDDGALAWIRRAPCVVVAATPRGATASGAPDLVVGAGDELLEALLARIEANPHASRALVDVLRPMPELDVTTGLTLESLAYSTLLAGPEFAAWQASRSRPAPRDHDGHPVRVERRGGELRITLARPSNRNAFSAALRDALFEAMTLAEVDASVERVVLDANGPAFSSGGDLTEFGTAPDVVRAHEVRTQRSVGALLARLGERAVVHVHGTCVGAGVELPAFAARVVADRGSTFRLPEVGMGLIPGAGGTVSITRRIGRQATARLAILGEAIHAAEALALGLVDELTDG
jgi:enoyl-CoA hydratase/carnithine racemase